MTDRISARKTGQWITETRRDPSPDWDNFVEAQPHASVYFLSGWTLLVREAFNHGVYFLETRDMAGQLRGVLPIVHQKSFLGNFATSIAFFNYGGALSESDEIANCLMEQARNLAAELSCGYLELRDSVKRETTWQMRTDKVSMVLQLPETFEQLSKALGSKLRSQVKRTDRSESSVQVGGLSLVADFYQVFAYNMRDLGTPVYPISFFEAIVNRFTNNCRLVVIYSHGKPVAAGFVIIYKGAAEIPWAACHADAKPLGFNMKLYWEVLGLVVAEKCRSFDFGRSTVDAGTYKFKKQWGAQPVQLYWYRWEKHSAVNSAAGGTSPGRLMQYASAIWQRLPISIANTVGPWISPRLPW